MFIQNKSPLHGTTLDPVDADVLSVENARKVSEHFRHRSSYRPTPLHDMRSLAEHLGVARVHVKDEGLRLGLGSFKALGGSYAVIRLVLENASEAMGRQVDIEQLGDADVRAIAGRITVACATDGNHGRSVAYGAQLAGARSAIFVHSGVSDERVAAIARYGAEIIRVEGNYDDSVEEATRRCEKNGWLVVSDTSWPGYERIPALVMQGYTAIITEALQQMPEPPTHFFIQAGVGGVAAGLAGHFATVLGEKRPKVIVVEPDRAACIYKTAQLGRRVKIAPEEPTIMAMLECYEPSLVAWRILSRLADAFMTVGEEAAVDAMKRFAVPLGGDPRIIAGESGGVGLAGFVAIAGDAEARALIGLKGNSRVFLVNTEGATDPELYLRLVGASPRVTRFT